MSPISGRHVREHRSLRAAAQKRALNRIAARLPERIHSDHLSGLEVDARRRRLESCARSPALTRPLRTDSSLRSGRDDCSGGAAGSVPCIGGPQHACSVRRRADAIAKRRAESRVRNNFKVFAMVGAMGFVVQLTVVALLTTLALWPYWTATIAAVEVAILHNFWWHEQWTWRERSTDAGVAARLLRFHVGAGCISIAGNLLITTLGVEFLHVGAITANIAAVALTSLANFWVADRWVFHASESARPEGLACEFNLNTWPRGKGRSAVAHGPNDDACGLEATPEAGRQRRGARRVSVDADRVGLDRQKGTVCRDDRSFSHQPNRASNHNSRIMNDDSRV